MQKYTNTQFPRHMYNVTLTFFAIILTVTIIIVPTYAADRQDIENLKQDQRDLQIKKIQLNDDLDKLKAEIILVEKRLTLEKAEEKKLRAESSTSWESVSNVDQAKANILATERELKILNDKRQDLINQIAAIDPRILEIDKEIDGVFKEVLRGNFNATTLKKAIGIKLSNNCMSLVNNNFTSQCPTYEDLKQLDSSIPWVSGEFGIQDGVYKRLDPTLKKSWRYYDDDKTPRIFVDPPQGMSERISMITIESSLDVFFLAGDHLITNNTRSHHQDAYIHTCRSATVGADTWKDTIGYVIYDLRNGCVFDTLQNKVFVTTNKTEIDISTTASWKYNEWMVKSKEVCKTICKEY